MFDGFLVTPLNYSVRKCVIRNLQLDVIQDNLVFVALYKNNFVSTYIIICILMAIVRHTSRSAVFAIASTLSTSFRLSMVVLAERVSICLSNFSILIIKFRIIVLYRLLSFECCSCALYFVSRLIQIVYCE
jgi:hypothetical protein